MNFRQLTFVMALLIGASAPARALDLEKLVFRNNRGTVETELDRSLERMFGEWSKLHEAQRRHLVALIRAEYESQLADYLLSLEIFRRPNLPTPG